jgi:hypothetical protein
MKRNRSRPTKQNAPPSPKTRDEKPAVLFTIREFYDDRQFPSLKSLNGLEQYFPLRYRGKL